MRDMRIHTYKYDSQTHAHTHARTHSCHHKKDIICCLMSFATAKKLEAVRYHLLPDDWRNNVEEGNGHDCRFSGTG